MSSLLKILKKYLYFSESGVILLGGIDNLDPYLAKVEKYYVFSEVLNVLPDIPTARQPFSFLTSHSTQNRLVSETLIFDNFLESHWVLLQPLGST